MFTVEGVENAFSDKILRRSDIFFDLKMIEYFFLNSNGSCSFMLSEFVFLFEQYSEQTVCLFIFELWRCLIINLKPKLCYFEKVKKR